MTPSDPAEPSAGNQQQDDPFLGRVIADKFCIRERIGAGAAGSVYRADQTSLGRTVAVKLLRPELASDPRFVRRFHDEAQAASRLNHPNVVSVIDFGQTEDGVLYLVMEFVRGHTLTEILRTEQPESRRIVKILNQVLSALEEAHAAGVVHADLKSDNIMVERRRGGWDLIKVVDFGIARLTGNQEEERDRSICGTPEYMSPEVIQGAEPTPLSDIYSVGVMLYEILVGFTPFSGVPTMDVLKRHINEAPKPPNELRKGIPIELQEIALRALSKNPADRFPSAQSFAVALRTLEVDVDQKVACQKCGVPSSRAFKFCPECGESRGIPREVEIRLEDTGREEFWTDDNTPTADLVLSEMEELRGAGELQDGPAAKLLPLPRVGHSAAYRRVVEFVQNEETRVLHVVGGRGSGRSRLIREACTEAAADGRVVFVAGADPNLMATPLYPIRAMIAACMQLPPQCSYQAIAEALLALGLNRRDLPGIGELFQHEGGGLHQLEGAVRKRELFASTMRVLRATSANYSAVLTFEDVHLYDQPSLHILERLIETNQRAPAIHLILSSDTDTKLHRHVARTMPEFLDEESSGIERIVLEPLGRPELERIIAHIRHHKGELLTLDDLERLSKGNPGHLTQVVCFALDGGNVETAPESLADLIAARVDFLPQVAKRVLQALSVFGLEVEAEVLSDFLNTTVTKTELEAVLALVERRGFISNQGGIIAFSDRLVRDVIYESCPADVRRTYHLEAGEVLISLVGDPLILGMHAERAGANERAAELLTRAADNSIKQLDDFGAADLYSRALSAARAHMLVTEDERFSLQMIAISIKLADALRICERYDLARGILAEAEGESGGAPALRAQLLRARGTLRASEGDNESAIKRFREAIALAIPVLAVDVLTDAYLDLATILMRENQLETAVQELEEGIDLITMGEGPAARTPPSRFWRLLLRASQLYERQKKSRRALELAQHSARLAQANRSRVGTARSFATIAGILESMGETTRAQAYRRQAIDGMRELGDRRSTAELLLHGNRPTGDMRRITPAGVREARLLAEEIDWQEGVEQAQE